ncbi:MAG: DNA mismatch repair protein MutS [Alteromonas naphthalenivorans]|jgi:DNA mismatch repair protein MutS
MILKKRLLTLVLLISSYGYAEQEVEEIHPFVALGNSHLNAFQKNVIKKDENSKKEKSLFSRMTGLDDPNFSINKLDDTNYDYHNLFYNKIFPYGSISAKNSVISPLIWSDLELLCGNHNKSATILSEIDRTTTGFGHAYLSYILTTPTDNITTLENRQAIIRTLVENQELANFIEKQLQDIKDKESAFLHFWQSENSNSNKIFLDNLYVHKDSWLEPLNRSTLWQETKTDLGHTLTIVLPIVLSPIQAAWAARRFSTAKGSIISIIKNAPSLGYSLLTDPKTSLQAKLLIIGSSALLVANQALSMKSSIDNQIQHANLLNYVHEQTNGVATIIDTLSSFEETFKEHPVFLNLEHIKAIKDVIQQTTVLSKELNNLVTLLKTNTFKGKQTIFSLKGRVRVAYYLLQNIKQELVPAFYAIGELDAYLSTAKLYTEFADKRVGYTFASYDIADKPHITMNNMWNPFVPIEKVVVNSISLGQDRPQNIILTGPNAGGKSCFLKGLATSILMAQTLGIAPVKELTFTPFTKINTYMNITDDTAGGNSLFKSEVLRAQGLLETVKSLDSKKFSLSIMDEMFSGTSPREGEATSYGVAKRLGTIDNSILLLASHFPKLKNLESKTPNFKNYQVRVVRHDNGSFSYPFKLEEGAADQNVAIDILKQQGFDSSILDDANELLNELD